MAVPRILVAVPNAATRELWRIAESGEIDELEGVLPQADINARNEHGMTALMRAAYHGRVQMVRVLLQHGADPNLTRNDQFTAVSLAAFFGHAEIVDLLMRHGANTDAATRFGTSPRMWATARSFGDVARSLEKRREEKRPAAREPEPVQTVAREPVLPPPVPEVKTLKDPPEIWDLVHEAPRNFNARSAFMTRIGSRRGAFMLPIVALLIVASAGVSAAWFFKDRLNFRWVNSEAAATVPSSTAPAPVSTTPAIQADNVVPDTNTVSETPPAVVEDVVSIETNRTVARRSRSFARSRAIEADVGGQSEPVQATVPPPPIVVPKSDSQTNDGETKKAAPVNTQVIAPSKSAQPKGKVIQWP